SHAAQYALGYVFDDRALIVEFLHCRDEWDHDLRLDDDSAPHRAHRRLEDGSRLHFCNLRVRNPQPAAAMAKHRVRFPKRLYDTIQVRARHIESAGKQLRLLTAVRKELVQGRIEQADGDRQAVHCLEDSLKIGALHRQQLAERSPSPALFARDDHLAHCRDPIALEELFAVAAIDSEQSALQVYAKLLAADDGAFPHSASDDRGVTRHATPRREYRAGGDDTVKIFRRRLIANKDDVLAAVRT